MLTAPEQNARSRFHTRRPTVRGTRLATGLVLFGYVLTHLCDHALGNVSLGAMNAGLDWAAWIWLSPVGLSALYGSLLVHMALGLAALYQRRSLRLSASEAGQLILGLAIPPLLVRHVVMTRLSEITFGVGKGYPQELYNFWVGSPILGAVQVLLLVVAWIHGCLGLYFWLRLKPAFPKWRSFLSSVATLVPVLALLGFAQGGREVAALATSPSWRAANLGPTQVGSPAQNATLVAVNTSFLAGYAALVVLVLVARVMRAQRRSGLVAISYAGGRTVHVVRGLTVLDASRLHGIAHTSVCGGRGRCSTCRVRLLGKGVTSVPPPSAAEQTVLDRIGARPGVRLACQLRPTSDIAVLPLLPTPVAAQKAQGPGPALSGEERFVVAVFVDMRGSTSLAAAHLPFDTVFIISRFLTVVAQAIVEEGGTPNQFLGDGLLALFGLSANPAVAAAQAVRAVQSIGAAVKALNAAMVVELDRPIRFGIGVHAGTAIVGEVGDGAHTTFTAIGDPVNVASRLQDLTKTFSCAAIVSEAVYEAAGMVPEGTARAVTVRGAETEIAVRLLHPALSQS